MNVDPTDVVLYATLAALIAAVLLALLGRTARFGRLFHEPEDPALTGIKDQLETEKVRHSDELTKIGDAMESLGAEYDRAEEARKNEARRPTDA